MGFLYPGRNLAWHHKVNGCQTLGIPAILAQQRDTAKLEPVGLLKSTDDILGPAAGRSDDHHIAGPPEGAHLPREHFVERVIIANRRQEAAVGGQIDRRKGLTVFQEAADIFCGEIGYVGGAASIAARHQLAAMAQTAFHKSGSPHDAVLKRA